MLWKELTTGIYPWDIHDEGIENILDNLQKYAGNNAAYMLALMHHEKRPLHANYYPHNPGGTLADTRTFCTNAARSFLTGFPVAVHLPKI